MGGKKAEKTALVLYSDLVDMTSTKHNRSSVTQLHLDQLHTTLLLLTAPIQYSRHRLQMSLTSSNHLVHLHPILTSHMTLRDSSC